MKIIERKNIDLVKWDALVEKTKGSTVFSTSSYLDAVAENWCVWTDEKYTSGIALPYSVRLGVKTVYTPLFLRYLEWLGEDTKQQSLDFLKDYFQAAELSVRLKGREVEEGEMIYQRIEKDTIAEMNEQARRMVRRFEKSGMQLHESNDPNSIFSIIAEELSVKIDTINAHSLQSLRKLVEAFSRKGKLKIVEVTQDDEVLGGAFFVDFNDRVLYLKSAFREKAKKEGAMYSIMQQQILRANQVQKVFDFGGSRVEGVRRFNLNLGGKDEAYVNLKWEHYPKWYSAIKKIKNQFK